MLWWVILVNILIVLVIGLIGGMSTRNRVEAPTSYYQMYEPEFAPKPIVFGIVWLVMYILLAIAGSYILNSVIELSVPENIAITALFYTGLFLNLLWTPVFFAWKKPVWALFLLVLLILVNIATFALCFAEESWVPGALLTVYAAWLFFALALNSQFIKNQNKLEDQSQHKFGINNQSTRRSSSEF